MTQLHFIPHDLGAPPSMPPLLAARNLSRSFGSKHALAGISFELRPGDILALLGPNGAGKTTFLRLALGLLAPTGGDIELLGLSARRLAIQGGGQVGSLGDGMEPPPWATIALLESLQSAASAHFSRAAFRRFCNQHSFLRDQRFGTLSKGQKRSLLAALALAMQPDVILFDEPADGLDPSARRELYDDLRATVTERQSGAIVTTHILSDIERIADHIVILQHGSVIFQCPLEDAREQIRAIEWPTHAGPLPDGFFPLSRQNLEGFELIVARASNSEAFDQLPVRSRPMTLEALYLALTKHPVEARS